MIIIPSDIEGCPMTEVIAMARSTESGTWLLARLGGGGGGEGFQIHCSSCVNICGPLRETFPTAIQLVPNPVNWSPNYHPLWSLKITQCPIFSFSNYQDLFRWPRIHSTHPQPIQLVAYPLHCTKTPCSTSSCFASLSPQLSQFGNVEFV